MKTQYQEVANLLKSRRLPANRYPLLMLLGALGFVMFTGLRATVEGLFGNKQFLW